MKYVLKPLSELMSLTEKDVGDAMVPVRIRKASSQAAVLVAELEEEIIRVNAEIQELSLRKDIDIVRIADKIDEVELLELRQSRVEAIVQQLFPPAQ